MLFLLGSVFNALADDAEEAAEAGEAARLRLPLAQINGKPITIYYFEAAAARLERPERHALASPSGKEAFLNELITTRLQAEEAIRRGYDRHETVQALLRKKLASMMEIVIRSPVDGLEPSEDELRLYYEQHLDEFQRPEMMRARLPNSLPNRNRNRKISRRKNQMQNRIRFRRRHT